MASCCTLPDGTNKWLNYEGREGEREERGREERGRREEGERERYPHGWEGEARGKEDREGGEYQSLESSCMQELHHHSATPSSLSPQ